MGRVIDITGQKFNRITAIERTSKKKNNRYIWKGICDCGNEVFVTASSLISNNTKSCGCLNIEKIQERNMDMRKYKFNLDYFNHMSPNLAYILGFFASDGTMTKNQWDIKFTLSVKDKELLEKIAKEISFTGNVNDIKSKIKDKEFNSSILRISSKKLYEKFEELGFSNNKSLNVGIPKCISNEYMIHFIRGFFDGDGSVGGQKSIKTQSQQIRVRIGCGSELIITQIRDWLYDNIKVRNVNITTDKRKNNWFEITYSTKDSLKLYESFYSDDNFLYLKRKKDKFEELIRLRNVGVK